MVPFPVLEYPTECAVRLQHCVPFYNKFSLVTFEGNASQHFFLFLRQSGLAEVHVLFMFWLFEQNKVGPG